MELDMHENTFHSTREQLRISVDPTNAPGVASNSNCLFLPQFSPVPLW
jgi:hypothetical protein